MEIYIIESQGIRASVFAFSSAAAALAYSEAHGIYGAIISMKVHS